MHRTAAIRASFECASALPFNVYVIRYGLHARPVRRTD